MSRRGRGGGRGKGGRFSGGSQKIGGLELSWDPDLDLDRPQPSPTFPLYKPAQPQSLTALEKRQVAHLLAIQKRIHEGPYYTILGDDVRVGKAASRAAAIFDPFEGMPKYSEKYAKKRRKLPDFSGRKYELKYFPKELHSTLDPSIAMVNGAGTINHGKKVNLSKAKALNVVDAVEGTTGVEGDEEETAPKEGNPDDEEQEEAEDVDDDFDEDDDDGGDYNAEKYFEDGQDDIGEDIDGDGDGGDYF